MADDPAIERLVVALPGSDLLRVYLPAPEPGTVVDHEGKVLRTKQWDTLPIGVLVIDTRPLPAPSTPEATDA